jgi:hypothetical protein
MKARSKELLDRAITAMLAAIEVYNKPTFPYRAESFTILAVNAWELLLKAKWLADHKNRLSSLYVRQGGGTKRKRIKKTAAGNPYTHSLDYLANKLRETNALDTKAGQNLKVLSELRDSAVHFYHQNPQFAERLQEIGAAVKNFHAAVFDWFGDNLSRYNFYLMPLAFVGLPPASEAVVLNPEEKRLLKYVSDLGSADDDPESRYSVAVNVALRFEKSKAKDAMAVKVTTDPKAPAVRFTEDQIRERYPWDYWQLTARCRERYAGFKVDKTYHGIRKSLESDTRYVHIRRLDPTNPKSPKKVFYSSAILEKLDTHYKPKT